MIALGLWIFTVAAVLVILLHLVLVAGAPIGFMTMGGRNPGVLPASARKSSLAQAVIVACFIVIVWDTAGRISFMQGAPWMIWVVVAVSAVSLVANTITPSVRERYFGIPATLGMLGGSLLVALGD